MTYQYTTDDYIKTVGPFSKNNLLNYLEENSITDGYIQIFERNEYTELFENEYIETIYTEEFLKRCKGIKC